MLRAASGRFVLLYKPSKWATFRGILEQFSVSIRSRVSNHIPIRSRSSQPLPWMVPPFQQEQIIEEVILRREHAAAGVGVGRSGVRYTM